MLPDRITNLIIRRTRACNLDNDEAGILGTALKTNDHYISKTAYRIVPSSLAKGTISPLCSLPT